MEFINPVSLRFKIKLTTCVLTLMKWHLTCMLLKVDPDRWLPSRPPRDERIVSTATCRQLRISNTFCLIAQLTQAFRHVTVFCLDMTKERNADQMPSVACYIHLCFHARMSDESHLAPHPGL